MPKYIPKKNVYLVNVFFAKLSLILLHSAKYVQFSFNDIKMGPNHLSSVLPISHFCNE